MRALAGLVVGTDPGVRAAARAVLADAFSDVAVTVLAGETVAAALAELPADHVVGLVVLVAGSRSVDELTEELADDPRSADACTLLLTDRVHHDDLAGTIDGDRLQALLTLPLTPASFGAQARAQLARWLRARDHDDPRLDLLDTDGRPLELPTSSLLRDLELDDRSVTRRLLDAVERALGPRPRLALPAGTRLTHQGRGIDAVMLVLRGTVALTRATDVGELQLHHTSTGPLIGLLSLAQRRRAFFTARATTDIEVIHLSLEQLDLALHTEPEVGAAMAAVTVRALAQRLRRAEQLQIRRIELNRELEAERQRLEDALAELASTRLELLESARMATLGELAAGVAHELNNPVAALSRAASHLADDLVELLAGHPRAPLLREVLEERRHRVPTSTAEDRAVRRAVRAAVGDERVADQLVAAGVTDPQRARELAQLDGPTREELRRAAGLGTALRNLELAGERIAELVDSLRAYARPSADPVPDVDVHATLEDTLQLVAHRLEGVELVRDYADQLPRIRAHPGPLGQVWTNLLINAAEALGGDGRIRVITASTDPDHVRVAIEDDGPGMSEEVRAQLFTPRFTTKQGTVRYGLGLGLAIAKRIVDSHEGTITVTSQPGRTRVTVTLPVAGPDEPAERPQRSRGEEQRG